MDDIVITVIISIISVIIGFGLSQLAIRSNRKQENLKKIKLLTQDLIILESRINMFGEDIANRKDFDEFFELYQKCDFSLKISEVSSKMNSIDFNEGENIDIFLNFDNLRYNIKLLDELFKKYHEIEGEHHIDDFYRELSRVGFQIHAGLLAIRLKIECVYLKKPLN
jgi:hypothetical protein